MKFTCNREIFFDYISKVSRAVSAKSTIPALEGIFIKAERGNIYLTGYDLELGVSTSMPAEVKEEGSIVLNARLLIDIISKLPGSTVSFSKNDLLITIKSGITEFTILGNSAEDFPELPEVEYDEMISIDGISLKSMIDQTIFAVSVTDQNPVHTGSLFDIEDGEIKMVSVDGCRLALRREKIDYQGSKKFVVPSKTLLEVSRFINPETEENVDFGVTKKHIVVKIDNLTVISRLLEGDFLDYKAAIATKVNTKIKIDVKTLLDSVNRVSLLITDRIKSPIKCIFEDNTLKMSCATAVGKAYDEIFCDMQGENFEIGFNNKYLADALKAVSCDEVYLLVNNSFSPMQIVPCESDEFLFLVLPVRLKG